MVAGVHRTIQTQDVVFFQFFGVLRIVEKVLNDLHPKVARNPWDFGFGLTGPSL